MWFQAIEERVDALPSWISVPLMVGSGVVMLALILAAIIGGAAYLLWSGYNILADYGIVSPLL